MSPHQLSPTGVLISNLFNRPILEVSCGRAALTYGMSQLNLSRMDEVLIPKFLCHAVVSSICPYATPSLRLSSSTKAIFLYHQFGYPQNLYDIIEFARSKDIYIINDCVHSLWSESHGRKIPTLGDFAIFSYGKSFGGHLGGAFMANTDACAVDNSIPPDLKSYFSKAYADSHRKLCQLSQDSSNQSSHIAHIERMTIYGALPYIYSLDHSVHTDPPWPASSDQLLALSSKLYTFANLIYSELSSIVPSLSTSETVIPHSIPILLKDSFLPEALAVVNSKVSGAASILHFDVNRNVLNPNYRLCLVLDLNTFTNLNQLCSVTDYLGSLN